MIRTTGKALLIYFGIVLTALLIAYWPGGPLNKHDWLQDRLDVYLKAQNAKEGSGIPERPRNNVLHYEMYFMQVHFPDVMKESLCFDICLKHGELRRIECDQAKRK